MASVSTFNPAEFVACIDSFVESLPAEDVYNLFSLPLGDATAVESAPTHYTTSEMPQPPPVPLSVVSVDYNTPAAEDSDGEPLTGVCLNNPPEDSPIQDWPPVNLAMIPVAFVLDPTKCIRKRGRPFKNLVGGTRGLLKRDWRTTLPVIKSYEIVEMQLV